MPPIPNQTKSRAILAAEYFIWKNKTTPQATGLGKLKLQKLLYYAQAWNLVINKNRLFSEDLEAWIHGPAVAMVYHHFKEFNFENPTIELSEQSFADFTEKEKKLLDEIWRLYGKYDGPYLEALTHNELPWLEARGNMEKNQPSQNIISTDTMRDFYAKVAITSGS